MEIPSLGVQLIPKLGVQSELQLLADATAAVTQDLSNVYDLDHSSWERRILILTH